MCTNITGQLTLIGSGIVQVEEDGNQDVQHVAALQHEEQELLKKRKSFIYFISEQSCVCYNPPFCVQILTDGNFIDRKMADASLLPLKAQNLNQIIPDLSAGVAVMVELRRPVPAHTPLRLNQEQGSAVTYDVPPLFDSLKRLRCV